MFRCRFIILIWSMAMISGCRNTPQDQHVMTSDEPESTLLSSLKKDGDAYILEWPLLLNTKMQEQYVDEIGIVTDIPVFSDTLRALVGKTVIIKGHYIPVEETGEEGIVILSAFPYAKCFFCGAAGVESIIDILDTDKLPKIKGDAKVKFKGEFALNEKDFDYLIYMLKNSQLISVEK